MALLVCVLIPAAVAPGASAVVISAANGHLLGVTPQRGVAAGHLGTMAVPHIRSAQAASQAQSSQPSGDMTYHGGPVLHSSAPYLVLWAPPGDAIPSDWPPLLERYFTDVAAAGSAPAGVDAVDHQYYDATGYAGASQTFSSSQVISDTDGYPAIDANTCRGTTAAHCITDGQVQQELTQLVSSRGLPTDGSANPTSFAPNAPIYFVVLPPSVDECFSSGDCAAHDYCSYHSSFVDSGGHEVLYDVIPSVVLSSPGAAKNCQIDGNQALQEPNNSLADVMLKYLMHDATETVTDPLLNGWWSAGDNNNEVADNCNQYGSTFDPVSGSAPDAFTPYLGGGTDGTLYNQALGGDHFYLQGVWSNTRNDCALQPAPATITAQFTVPAGPDVTNTDLTFDPSASSSPDGYSSVIWDWGDGTPPQLTHGAPPAGSTHHYATAGRDTITLTIVDTEGNVATTTHTITVYSPPKATFTFSPTSPYAGDSVIFDASGSSDAGPGGTITNYAWSFGDGSKLSSPTAVHPAHTYNAPGNYRVALTVTNSAGLTSTTLQPVAVVAEPAGAGFTIQPTSATVNQPVSFTAVAGNTNYTWDFGDKTPVVSSTSNATTHAYTTSGTYTVQLLATAGDGTQTVVLHQLTVGPLAAFTYSPPQPSNLTQITFDGSSSTDPDEQTASLTYAWDFGDGSPAAQGATAPHQYAHPGTYTVTLTVTNGLGETNSVSRDVTVGDAPPTPSFSVTTGVAAPGVPVGFDATTSAPSDPSDSIASYAWTFGDAGTGSGPKPSHTYAAGGTYTVTLTVTDSHGASSTESQQVVVHPPPIAAFSYLPSQPANGTQITFDGSGSSDPEPGQSVSAYSWNFGDSSPAGHGKTDAHTYAHPGTYTVTLTVTNAFGEPASTSRRVAVAAAPPTAAFSTTTSPAIRGQPVAFAATATPSDPSASISSYAWSFGDSSNGSGAAPSHPYGATGTYTVTLTVTDSNGASSAVSHQVVVHALPVPAFSASPGHPLAGTPVSFNGGGSQDPEAGVGLTSFDWRFGDGATGSGANPSHTYAAPGTYTVVLTTINSLGLSATTSRHVTVASAPRVAVILRTTRPASGQPVAFAAFPVTDSAASVVAYSWSFGDRTAPASGPTPSHVYSRPGVYTVSLTITDSFGHTATSAVRVPVALAGRIAKVSLSPTGAKLLVTLNTPGVLTVQGRTFRVKKARTVAVAVRLSAAQRRKLAATHSLSLKVQLRFVPAAGPRQTRTVIIVFRPPHAATARITHP